MRPDPQAARCCVVLALALFVAVLLAGCNERVPIVETFAVTEKTESLHRDPAFWIHPEDTSLSLIIGADFRSGLETFTLAGELLEVVDNPVDDKGSRGVDVRYDFPIDDGTALIASASVEPAIDFYTVNRESRKLVDLGAIRLSFVPRAVCLHRNPSDDSYFAFALAGDGGVEQWKLTADGSRVVSAVSDANGVPRPVRSFEVGGDLSACVVDDPTGTLYVAEEDNALWAYRADPVGSKSRRLVDAALPIGHLGELNGIALARGDDGRTMIVGGDEVGGFLVIQPDGSEPPLLGRFAVRASDTAHVLQDVGRLEVASGPISEHPRGIAVVRADVGYYLVDLARIGEVLGIAFSDSWDAQPAAEQAVARVRAEVETEPTPHALDAADDPAIWVHPRDAAKSVILATDKKRGLLAHDLSGRRIHYVRAGRFDNVDLRDGFELGGESVSLVAVSDRSRDAIALYRVNPAYVDDPSEPFLERLTADSAVTVRGQIQVRARPIYGLCLSQDATGTSAFVTSDNGQVEQWALVGREDGTVAAHSVRWFELGSRTEGCVVDDEHGWLYIGEESRGIWRVPADAGAELTGTLIDKVGDGRLVADVEGLSIYERGTEGYLVASSQGNSTFVVYDRRTAEPLGVFRIVADDALGVDGVEDCDGIAITSRALGPSYPQGMMVVQDGYNVDAVYRRMNQNFKLVSWQRIAEALNLPDAR